MARSRNTADTQTASGGPVSPFVAGKNKLINGNMQIAQRGTSFTSITSGLNYGADRYNLEPSNLGTYTVTNVSDAPTVLGQAKSFKVLVTTANASPAVTAYSIFQTVIEGQASQFLAKGTASAQISTLSFWTKSNKTGTYSLIVYDAINSRAFGANYTISTVDTWEKKTITVPADATGTITNDNAVGMRIYWNLAGGANLTSGSLLSSWGAFSFGTNWMPGQTNLAANVNNYWQITGIQWELGSTATPFETSTGSIPGELAACQRYYFRTQTGTNEPYMGVTVAGSSTTTYANIIMKQTMRTTPSSVDFSAIKWQAINNSGNITAASISGATPENVLLVCTTTGATAGAMNYLMGQTSSGYVGFSAEL